MTTELLSPLETEAESTGARSLRIDPPHVSPQYADVPPADEATDSTDPLLEHEEAWAQMRTQARQLAELLRARQEELDRREANVYAQAATWEQEARSGRLWLNGQIDALAHRDATVSLASAEASSSFSAMGASLDERWDALARAEALLAQDRLEIDALRKMAEAEASRWREQAASERQQLAALRRQTEEELQQKRDAAAQETSRLEARRSELEQIKERVRESERETLEMRLATEELFGQLAAAVPPALLTRSLGRVRQRLADQLRLANTELADQKQELELLRVRLRDHHDQLARRRQELNEWFERRQSELQQQAEALALREEELRRQEEQCQQAQNRWCEERLGYRQQIRELLAAGRTEMSAVSNS
jgi:hypothetical protein